MRYKKIIILTLVLSVVNVFATIGSQLRLQSTNYRTYFGSCPSRVAGNLALKLVKVFEEKKSLKALKEKMIKENLSEKHFLSSYAIKYDSSKNMLKFKFECPRPLMKVQIYKNNGVESYGAILVDNGKLFDPTYEVLMRAEKKLKHELPSLALPVGEIENDLQERVSKMVVNMPQKFRRKLSEIILSENNELTVIFSMKNRPSSAFLGTLGWEEKMEKLEKIIGYMAKKKKVPSIINLTNSKKVVVKFSDKI